MDAILPKLELMGHKWYWRSSILALTRWYPCFNLGLNPSPKILVWAKPLGILLEHWIERYLRNIGDYFGKMLDVDSTYKTSS
jgi:hypothetical protein